MTIMDATGFEDVYPTRVAGAPQPIDRTDPTVWGEETDGPLDAATLAAHDAKGYHIAEGLLSPAEVQAYWEELVRLSGDPQLATDERVITEKRSGEVRSILEVHKISALIGAPVR